MIRTCTCKHESQDKLHGKGKRVFNSFSAKNGVKMLRCTVCLREISE